MLPDLMQLALGLSARIGLRPQRSARILQLILSLQQLPFQLLRLPHGLQCCADYDCGLQALQMP